MNDETPEPPSRTILRVIRGGLMAIAGLIFWFGDRALREFRHFSFSASLTAWIAALGIVILLAVLLTGLIDS